MKLSDFLAERVGDEKANYFIIIVNSTSSFVTACQHTLMGSTPAASTNYIERNQ